MTSEYDIRPVPMYIRSEKSRVDALLARNGLRYEPVDTFYGVYDCDDELLGGGGVVRVDRGEADEAVAYQVEEDRKQLSRIAGYEVVGMAYPCGGVNNDDRVAGVIKAQTGVKYSRTITSSHSFDMPKNLHRLNPTVYICETDKMFELADQFIALKTDKPQMFYIWGHSYEFDVMDHINWEKFEQFCRLISGKEDIIYGTNTEVLTEAGCI